jgi:hypothetical protein
MPRFKFNQDVYVAVPPEIIPQNRPEESQLADVVLAAEISNFVSVDRNASHLPPVNLCAAIFRPRLSLII